MSTPDLTSYRLIHQSIRNSTALLATATRDLPPSTRGDRSRQLSRWYAGFESELHTHHTVEDDIFFPALFARVPALRGHLERIDDEHHELEELLVATRAAIDALDDPAVPFEDAAAAASRRTSELDALMEGHLDYEDAEILPLFTRHMDAADYDEVEGRAMSSPKLGELRFTVPWMMANASPEEQRHLLDNAPFMMRVLWIATRRGYDRMATTALGASPAVSMAAVAS